MHVQGLLLKEMHAKELWMVPFVIVTGHAWIYVSDGQTADKTFIQRLVYLKLRFGIQRTLEDWSKADLLLREKICFTRRIVNILSHSPV